MQLFADPKTRLVQDSFLDALQSEILAGTENLASWIRYVESRGGIEILFELETWLKGLRAFFDLQHLPLSESERKDPASRSFCSEVSIARHAIQICEGATGELIKCGWTEKVEFESFIEGQLRKNDELDYHVSKIVEQPTPTDSMIQLSESLNDLRVMIDAVNEKEKLDCQLFLSLGRCYQRELRNCRYIEMLLAQRFRLQYDRVDNASLGSILRSIESERIRHNAALSLLWLFRLLKYLQLVHRDLCADRPLRHSSIIFSLLHAETQKLSTFLRAHFLRAGEAGHSLRDAIELIVYSLRIETRRALEQELIFSAREEDLRTIHAKIENIHSLLQNCYQSSIVTFAQAFDKSFDCRAVFPSMPESMQRSQRLRQDLWELRQYLKSILQNRSSMVISGIVEKVTAFRESSMRHLIYGDWREFECLSDSLVTAPSEVEVRALVHKFVSFLGTLVEEVSKRSVLRS